ncbi:MAG: serine/threonine protein kinase, partial [Oligoflexia bacterium]|nr:serine/threonine protein kinase [Oligoflexia bacterium]
MIGSVLDKYRILEKIGEGGMASVYRGEHVTLGREVAIKILHPHLSTQARSRQRFAREARAIENLRHDNILRIEDYSGESAPDCYIVTEFIDGETLQQLLADHGALPSEVVALIGLHLADALAYAHDLKIIHRDLKPENVMIKKDGTVKLMDFGIARFLDEMHLTLTGALVGSPAYMSPEQAMERVLDSRSDLFSLGTLLFHLVTGQLPFAGNNPSIVLRNIIEGNRPSVSDLAPTMACSLAELIHALLQTDPNYRPATARDVHDRLVDILAEVDLQPDDPEWSLQCWLVDPAGYADRLDERLRHVLLTRGKARLEARDHLGALQLFNRLLTIDERHGQQNEEVLALVQGMHGSQDAPRRSSTWLFAGLGLLAAASLLTWSLWPAPRTLSGAAPLTAI